MHKRITIATRIFEPEPAAAALRLGGLARALVKMGYEVTALTTTFKDCPKIECVDGFEIRRFPALRDRTGAVRGYLQYLSFDVPLMFRLMANRKPTAVVCEPPPTTGVATRVICALKNVPYVYYAGDIVSDAAAAAGMPTLLCSALRSLERTALKGAQLVIAVSEDVEARASALGATNVVVVPNGIDTSDYRENPPIPRGFPNTSGPTFLYAGTVAAWLGPEIFIHAFQKVRDTIPQAELVFLGQGTAWDELKRLAADLSIPVTFIDAVSPSETRDWNASADVALASVKPSGYDYAYPTKILAALAQGTPVIYAGPGPAAKDVSQNNLGRSVPFEIEAVAEAMIELGRQVQSHDKTANSRLRDWVVQNRSLAVSSKRAAELLVFD